MIYLPTPIGGNCYGCQSDPCAVNCIPEGCEGLSFTYTVTIDYDDRAEESCNVWKSRVWTVQWRPDWIPGVCVWADVFYPSEDISYYVQLTMGIAPGINGVSLGQGSIGDLPCSEMPGNASWDDAKFAGGCELIGLYTGGEALPPPGGWPFTATVS